MAPTRSAAMPPIHPLEALAHVPRGLRVALGVLAVILGVLVLAVDRFAVAAIQILFATAIIFLGLSAIAQGVASSKLPGWLRGLQVVFGVVSLGIGALYFIDPVFGLVFSTFLFGFGLVFTGFALLSSTATPGLPGWAQGLKSVIGVLEIVFGFIVVLTARFLEPSADPLADRSELVAFIPPTNSAARSDLMRLPRQRSWGSVLEAFIRHRDRKCSFDGQGRMVRRHILVRRSKIVGLGKEVNRIGDARVLGHAFVGGRAKTYVDWEARLLGVGRAEARRLELPWDFVMRAKRRLRSGSKLRADAAGRVRSALTQYRAMWLLPTP